jgi:hypothetical protein
MWEEARYEARNPQNSESSDYGYKFTIDTSQNSHLINERNPQSNGKEKHSRQPINQG